MQTYNTILTLAKSVFVEKKSEFIAKIAPAKSEGVALDFIKQICSEHKKARHNCYAYIIRDGAVERYSDDGEPGGTAGMPILYTLKSNKLCDVVCIVTRYFGGILLGAAGLARAYSRAASDVVKAASILEMRPAQIVIIKAEYTYYNRIVATVAEFGGLTEEEDFSDIVCITAVLPLESSKPFEKNQHSEHTDLINPTKTEEKLLDAFKIKLINLCNGFVCVNFEQKIYKNFVKL